ncbi:MAG: restriction endonuclease [Singulisphaera sp.]
MAKPSEKAIRYKEMAQELTWDALAELWQRIQDGTASEWDEGKALEHLVVRAFELSGLLVEYPYDVPPGGRPIEQIDGIVYLDYLPFLVECKDKGSVDIEAIAKLRNQLLRRPPTTMGCVFNTGAYTLPALILADFAVPHQITLWSGNDIEAALEGRDFREMLVKKYRDLCKFGLTDYSPNYKALEVKDE